MKNFDIWKDKDISIIKKIFFLVFIVFSPKIRNFQFNIFFLHPLDIQNRKEIIRDSILKYIK